MQKPTPSERPYPLPSAFLRQTPLFANALASALLAGFVGGLVEWHLLELPIGAAIPVGCAYATLAGLAALPVGLAECFVAALAESRFLGRGRWIRRARAVVRLASSRAPTLGRRWVVRLHASAAAWLLLLGGLAGLALAVGNRLLALQVRSVALLLLVALVASAALAASLFARFLTSIFEPIVAAFDRQNRLPLPPWRGSRLALFVCLPALGMVAVLLHTLAPYLGKLVWFFLLAALVATQLLLAAIARLARAWARKGRRQKLGAAALASCFVLLVAWSALRLRPGSSVIIAISRAPGMPSVLELARSLTDFDRDGASALFGGLDCAGLDAKRGPLAEEVPGNGRDEDCDGEDALASAEIPPPPKLEVFSKRLKGEEIRKYNVVWAIIDAVRADHTSLLGYRRRTTPYLESIAKESFVFSAAQSQSSATLFSLPSQFSGKNPNNLRWYRAEDPQLPAWHEAGLQQLAAEHETAAELFHAAGYRTGITLTTHLINSYKSIQRGYERVTDLWATEHHMVSSPVATAQAIQLIEEFRRGPVLPNKPFFLTVYYEDPHGPYAAHQEGYPDFGPNKLDAYDQEIAFADRYVGFLYEYLSNQPELWKDTIFIVSSDHGEEFFEHGWDWHSHSCYVESVHVPLLVRIPGMYPRQIDTPVGLVDILPTLLELTGLGPNKIKLDGQSLLVPVLAPEYVKAQRPLYCVISNRNLAQTPFFISSVRAHNRTLTYSLPEGVFRYFETDEDPEEKNDLFARKSGSQPVRLLRSWLRRESTGNLQDLAGFSPRLTSQR